MLPMLFAGGDGGSERRLDLGAPAPRDARAWRVASDAALEYWRALAGESQLSAAFRAVARDSVQKVQAWRDIARRLPS